jgi:sarcosine oxidase, subunit gamma
MRTSPVYDRLQLIDGTWREINGMRSLYSIPDEDAIAQRLGIADLSFLNRFGVKGAAAASWLETHRISIPDRPNTWNYLPESGLIARLGSIHLHEYIPSCVKISRSLSVAKR